MKPYSIKNLVNEREQLFDRLVDVERLIKSSICLGLLETTGLVFTAKADPEDDETIVYTAQDEEEEELVYVVINLDGDLYYIDDQTENQDYHDKIVEFVNTLK